MTPEEILALPMEPNDSGADTILSYLKALLTRLWDEGECFDSKRPFENSCWEGDLELALARAGVIEAKFDEDGYLDHCDSDKARELISQAIQAIR